jgi:hypothetical protein
MRHCRCDRDSRDRNVRREIDRAGRAGAARFTTVDTDYGPWTHVVEDEPLWREPLIEELLAQPRDTPLFVQGTVANQGRFYHRFDAVVLLTAPVEVIFDRLDTRTTNAFGKTPAQREQIARDIAQVQPLLREGATHEIDTTQPLSEVVDTLISIAQNPSGVLLEPVRVSASMSVSETVKRIDDEFADGTAKGVPDARHDIQISRAHECR